MGSDIITCIDNSVSKPSCAHAHAICLLTCSSRTPAALSLAPAAAYGPIAPKPETTIVDRGVKPTDHKGKYTHISCRCKYLARLVNKFTTVSTYAAVNEYVAVSKYIQRSTNIQQPSSPHHAPVAFARDLHHFVTCANFRAAHHV